MRLALVRKKYRIDGGAEKFLDLLLQVLTDVQRFTFNISLITQAWYSNKACNYNTIICKVAGLGRLRRERAFNLAAQKTFSQFDLVQSHERIPGCHIYRAGDGVHKEWLIQRSRSLSALKSKFLWYSRFHRYIMQQEQKLYQHPELKAVICNSKMVRDEIIANFGLSEKKIHVIYNGLDTNYFSQQVKVSRDSMRQKMQIPLTASVMLFVGSGFERKGLLTAIRALAPYPNVHLLVLGQDKRQHYYQNQANKLAARRVHFCGVQSELAPFYGMADAFLLPTLYDPFPNACLEAMACGLPVITSNKCGAREFIHAGVNGFVADAFDVNAYQDAIKRLQDKDFCMRAGELAALSVRELTIQNLSEEIVQLYSALCDNSLRI